MTKALIRIKMQVVKVTQHVLSPRKTMELAFLSRPSDPTIAEEQHIGDPFSGADAVLTLDVTSKSALAALKLGEFYYLELSE